MSASATATMSRSQTARGPRRSPARRPAGQSASAAGRSEAPGRDRLAAYRLTVRHGSSVGREGLATLDEAIAAIGDRVREIRREGPLEETNAIRDYRPGQQVHARLELSSGGLFRGREVGLDVMGDGSLVPYEGVVRKRL